MRNKRFLAGLFCWLISTCAFATNAFGQDDAYKKVAYERAIKIVEQLRLTDEEKVKRVTDLVAGQYIGLNRIHTERDNALGGNPANADRIKEDADNKVLQLHKSYLDKLATELNESQIESVKDGMTYNVVPLTFENYQLMIPYLAQRQKDTILLLLKEARELAMDGGSSDEKHAWFGKYKGKIANYLSKEGYRLKQLSNDWAERRKKDDTTLAITASNRIVAVLALDDHVLEERVRNLTAHHYQQMANANAEMKMQRDRYFKKLSEWLDGRQVGVVKREIAEFRRRGL